MYSIPPTRVYNPIMSAMLPRILADLPVAPAIAEALRNRVELLPWHLSQEAEAAQIEGIYTYGHPIVDENMLARMPKVRVISNFGVGVDHIEVAAAAERGIPVGNTPGVL